MPTLEAFLQVIAGAGGTGVVLGVWLWITLKKVVALEAKIESLNAKVEARDALRLGDHQGVMKDLALALQAEYEPSDPPKEPEEPQPRPPTGRHRRQP